VSVGSLTQSCLFGANNQIYFDALIPRRITQEDVANELGIGVTTVDRCLKGVGHPDTIESVKRVAERLGYKRVYKWASIKKEFIKGQDLKGRPVIDEQSVVILRKRGKSIRYISQISGICKPKISQILKINGESTENFQTIKDFNGLSKAQNIVLKNLKREKAALTLDAQFKIRGSWARKTAAKILRQYKNGFSVIRAAKNIFVDKGVAFLLVYKTKAYWFISNKRIKMHDRTGPSITRTYSSNYYDEKSMLCVVEEKLKEKFYKALIRKEANVASTFYGKNVRHLRADFVVERDNTKPLAVEVKVCTDCKSIKVLMGQILIYRTYGYDVQCVFPDDVFISEFAQNMLSKNNVTYWTV